MAQPSCGSAQSALKPCRNQFAFGADDQRNYAENGHKCKHIFAVEFVMRREENADGSTTMTQAVVITETKRKTYRQNWPAYNA